MAKDRRTKNKISGGSQFSRLSWKKESSQRQDQQDVANQADETSTGIFPAIKPEKPIRTRAVRSMRNWGELANSVSRHPRTRGIATTILIVLLCAALGYGFISQGRITDSSYLSLSETELVTLLDETNNQISRLQQQRSQLSEQLRSIQSAADKQKEIERIAQQNKDTNDIVAGTVPAVGQGIEIRISESNKHIPASALFTLINELRNAGAEVIEFGNVRIVTSSYIIDTSGGVQCDGVHLKSPYVVKAIGDKSNLQNAIEISGGIGSSIRVNYNAGVDVNSYDKVTIKAVTQTGTYKYAVKVE